MDTAEHRRAWAAALAVVVYFGLAGVYAWVYTPERGSALDQLGPWTGAVGLVLALVGTAWVWWPALRLPPPSPPSGKDANDEPRLILNPALAPASRLLQALLRR
ncbi:MAG: hypothetical protein RIT28_5004 [Pseudomonadota bacterium]